MVKSEESQFCPSLNFDHNIYIHHENSRELKSTYIYLPLFECNNARIRFPATCLDHTTQSSQLSCTRRVPTVFNTKNLLLISAIVQHNMSENYVEITR